jgi:hypothetical protein
VALIAYYLKRQGVLAAIEDQVHFARRRFGPVRDDRFCRGVAQLCDQW